MGTYGKSKPMKRKVILYFMLLILLTLSLVMVSFGLGMKRYFYQEIADTIEHHSEAAVPVWPRQGEFTTADLINHSDEIIKNYQIQGTELYVLKRNGQLIQSSSGFYEERNFPIDPTVLKYRTVYKTETSGYSGEKIMAVYTPLIYDGHVVGVLRYDTSLTGVDSKIFTLLCYGTVICLLVAVLVFLVSLHLGNSIVKPLKDIIHLTQRMAEGRYKEKIEKNYSHEAGELVRMLNHMADEILKADQLKNDFISSISHELRTPLTGIKGWIETMRDPEELTDEEMQFGLKIINDETERLISLVESLLDFSRYQSDRMVLSLSPVHLDDLIREVTFQLKKKAEKKEVNLQIETIPTVITADGDKLKQVMLNILDNAIKFSGEKGHILIHQTHKQDLAEIVIQDTGIGINTENLEYVTRSFYKIDPKSVGEGLGLAISQNIVELHGGTLQINSEYGKGTSVIISLPLKK